MTRSTLILAALALVACAVDPTIQRGSRPNEVRTRDPRPVFAPSEAYLRELGGTDHGEGYAHQSGSMCDNWHRVEGKQTTLLDLHTAWCEAFDLSPETCWCLTNQKALWEQVDAYTAACESGVEGSANAVIDAKRRQCGAFPD